MASAGTAGNASYNLCDCDGLRTIGVIERSIGTDSAILRSSPPEAREYWTSITLAVSVLTSGKAHYVNWGQPRLDPSVLKSALPALFSWLGFDSPASWTQEKPTPLPQPIRSDRGPMRDSTLHGASRLELRSRRSPIV